ncbi:inositol monophosphatase family protein [Zavarzinia sp. CC-PAN008]|uniref:inositol monophosphatase family protein n=1 Tax=Zavarzinia sp. CC-PAN008 TaxID=3243332 RepID=UPI003F743D10
MTIPAELIAVAEALAELSGAILRDRFRTVFRVDAKSDRSPVTEIDRLVEQTLREHLARVRPQDGVIGEEFGRDRADSEWVWVIDPIDGTKPFMTGRATFTTMIGLAHGGRPVFGLVDQPIVRDRWQGGPGLGLTMNGRAARTSGCTRLADAVLSTSSFEELSEERWARLRRVGLAARSVVLGGEGYTQALLAAGYLDAVIEGGMGVHDYVALSPLIEAGGGRMTGPKGEALGLETPGLTLAAATPALHAELVQAFGEG